MYRGTTPTITFKINTDIDLNEVAECWVTFKAHLGGEEKTFDKTDVIIDPLLKTIEVAMTQEETLFFKAGKIFVQIRLRMNDDLAYASDIKAMTMNGILKDGEI